MRSDLACRVVAPDPGMCALCDEDTLGSGDGL